MFFSTQLMAPLTLKDQRNIILSHVNRFYFIDLLSSDRIWIKRKIIGWYYTLHPISKIHITQTIFRGIHTNVLMKFLLHYSFMFLHKRRVRFDISHIFSTNYSHGLHVLSFDNHFGSNSNEKKNYSKTWSKSIFMKVAETFEMNFQTPISFNMLATFD